MPVKVDERIMHGLGLILEERHQQIHRHGRTIEKDIEFNTLDQLPMAASRLIYSDGTPGLPSAPEGWNTEQWYKMLNSPYEERLAVAGALISAQLDRLHYLKNNNV